MSKETDPLLLDRLEVLSETGVAPNSLATVTVASTINQLQRVGATWRDNPWLACAVACGAVEWPTTFPPWRVDPIAVAEGIRRRLVSIADASRIGGTIAVRILTNVDPAGEQGGIEDSVATLEIRWSGGEAAWYRIAWALSSTKPDTEGEPEAHWRRYP